MWLAISVAVLEVRSHPSLGAMTWIAMVLLGWGALLGTLLAKRGSIARSTATAFDAEQARRGFLLGSLAGVAMLSSVLFAIARRLSPGRTGRTREKGPRRARA